MENRTKIGFEVLKIVEIPNTWLRKNVLKAMDGKETYTDLSEGLNDPEKIYSGDVFDNILEDIAENPSQFTLDLMDMEQINSLAADLKDYELVRVSIY